MNAEVSLTDVCVPDIGDFKDIPVIEVLVAPGATISAGDPIVTLESEKATLDVPAPSNGRVATVEVQAGSRVSRGSLLLRLSNHSVSDATRASAGTPVAAEAAPVPPSDKTIPSPKVSAASSTHVPSRVPYASPSVRRIGRELGVELCDVNGSGRGGRILREDVHRWIRDRLEAPRPAAPAVPTVAPVPDFAKFGPIERQSLSRIQRISGPALARNWATIPHVTNLDEADVTELDRFRHSVNSENRSETKITLVSFLAQACASVLRQMPVFNSSLDGHDLILKRYIHIGIAVDTPAGLLVPVLRNVDQMGLRAIAADLAAKAGVARAGKLKVDDLQGGSFSISSLGAIGGGAFTPIINAPEVAILGAGRARIQPRWDGEKFVPRLVLPLSLSWDHRAADGALAARFLSQLVAMLEDFRRVSL
jgi:pyruvate dehydrogenase E2 component (dihydrolipoamide acetyltransferase)